MNRYFLLGLMVLMMACSNKRLELGGLHTRTQFDSIMALLPSDSIRIDSLPYRTLSIYIQGHLALHGFPLNEARFILKNEQLISMEASMPSGYLSLLNKMEQQFGLGKTKGSGFEWNTPEGDIELSNYNLFSSWSNKEQNISDSLGVSYHVKYTNWLSNEITELYKISQVDFTDYSLDLYNSSYCNPRFFVNNTEVHIPQNATSVNINHLIVENGKQELTVIVSEPMGSSTYSFAVVKQVRGSALKQVTQYPIEGLKQTNTFVVDNLGYSLDYAAGSDMGQIPDLKTRLYAKYKDLKDAFEQGDEKAIASLLYPVAKVLATANNWDKKHSLDYWNELQKIKDYNEGCELLDIDQLKVEFAQEGKLARLVPIDPKHETAMQIYIFPYDVYRLDHYLYSDSSNQLLFAL